MMRTAEHFARRTAPWPEACHCTRATQYRNRQQELRMKPLHLVTIVTLLLATACATSPRATSGPSPSVAPRDTTSPDTTRDTGRIPPDTSATALRAILR